MWGLHQSFRRSHQLNCVSGPAVLVTYCSSPVFLKTCSTSVNLTTVYGELNTVGDDGEDRDSWESALRSPWGIRFHAHLLLRDLMPVIPPSSLTLSPSLIILLQTEPIGLQTHCYFSRPTFKTKQDFFWTPLPPPATALFLFTKASKNIFLNSIPHLPFSLKPTLIGLSMHPSPVPWYCSC